MNNEIAKKLQELTKSYTKNLPSKLVELEHHWQALQQKWNNENYVNFYQKVHNLHGSAGVYGFAQVSKAAQKLEVHLKNCTYQPAEELYNQLQLSYQLLIETLKAANLQKQPDATTNIPAHTQPKIIFLLEKDGCFSQSMALQLNMQGFYTQIFENISSLPADKSQAIFIINVEMLDQELTTLLQNLKKQDMLSNTERLILFMSKEDNLEMHLKAIQAGANGFFIIPFQVEDVVDQIQTFYQNTRHAKVLIIDDNEEIANYYAQIITNAQMVPKILSHVSELDKILYEFNPDLLLMDIYMPQYSGLELATMIRQRKTFESIPIIFLSAENDPIRQLAAMNCGADDFIPKSANANFVIMAIKNRLKRYDVLRNLITKDGLTGVLNRSSIQQRLDNEIALAQRSQLPLSIAMVDLDHFKKINDNYGHPIGDQILKKLCHFFQQGLRKSDIIGRYGGEEFLLIFPNTDQETAKVIVDNIREKFSQETNIKYSNLVLTFSTGITCAPPFLTPALLIKESDEALYAAKHAGRNQVMVFKR